MEFLHIIKGDIKNIVTREQFERIYKPQGWEIEDATETTEEDNIKNFNLVQRHKRKHFDDGLIKDE